MKGFTLIETLVYMAVSAVISTSLISLAFTLANANTLIRQMARDEGVGIFLLRSAENAFRNGTDADLQAIAPDAPIRDISKSENSDIHSISFTINGKLFSISIYEK